MANYVIPVQIRETIAANLGVIGYKSNGWSKSNVRCPFHDDQTPSASLHCEKGLKCHTCNRMFTWKELSAELGVLWPFQTRQDVFAADDGEGDELDYIRGLPSETRNGLSSCGLSDLSRVLDFYYHYGYVFRDSRLTGVTLQGLTFIIEQVKARYYDVEIDITPRTVRKVFEQLQGRGLPKKANYLQGFFPSFFFQLKKVKKSANNSRRGRPDGSGLTIIIPNDMDCLGPLAAQLDREWYVSAGPLTIEDYATAQRYRAASMMQDVRYLMPGKVARKQFVKSVKVSYPTIKVYADVMNIQRTPTPPELTPLTPLDVIGLPENHKALMVAIMKKEIKPNVFLMDERGGRHEYSIAGVARATAKGGGKLYRAEWQASHYSQRKDTDE